MVSVAVTGSFASGKSFVLNIIKSMGYKVFSCDEYVRGLYQDEELQSLVLGAIPGLKQFDKKQLMQIIYRDEKARKELENIIHPLVRKGIKEFEEQNKNEKIIFIEVPLLFETGFDKYFDYTICVYCPENVRLERAKTRPNFDEEIFNKIQEIQLSPREKQKKADFSINSEANLLILGAKVQEIIDEIDE